MLPLVIAGGAAVVAGAAFFGLKKECGQCKSLWTMNKECQHCRRLVCGDCGTDVAEVTHKSWQVCEAGRVCKVCMSAFSEKLAKYKSAIDKSEEVKTFSGNYKGNVPAPKLNKTIFSQFHEEKDNAERELKIHAAASDCYSISDIKFDKEKRKAGNFIYTVWRASGKI